MAKRLIAAKGFGIAMQLMPAAFAAAAPCAVSSTATARSLLTPRMIRRKRAAHSTVAGQFGRRARSLSIRTICHWQAMQLLD